RSWRLAASVMAVRIARRGVAASGYVSEAASRPRTGPPQPRPGTGPGNHAPEPRPRTPPPNHTPCRSGVHSRGWGEMHDTKDNEQRSRRGAQAASNAWREPRTSARTELGRETITHG